MRKLIAIAGAALLLHASGAAAQIDPNPDGIGIYADLEATQTSVSADPGVPFEVYLVITRPSNSSGIMGWECGIDVPDNATIWGWNVAGDHWLNGGSPPEFEVGYGIDPLPSTDVVLLMTFIVYLSDENPAEFYIHECRAVPGLYDEPGYIASDDIGTLIPLHPWPRVQGEPAFKINDGTATPTLPATWGAVKALYRQ
jgi:hypothetical protein